MHNVHNVPLTGADGQPVREFRVSKVHRYQVTDWASFTGKGGVKTVADDLTLEQANRIAIDLGRANPGSLVNTMEPPYEGSYVMVTSPAAMAVAIDLTEDGALPEERALGVLPYEIAARIRRAADLCGDAKLTALLDRAQVAVDVKHEAPHVIMRADAALAIRANLRTLKMSTAEIDEALARARAAHGVVVTPV